MVRQELQAKKGEIEFRRKLSRQQVDGETLFADEYDATGIESILAERMGATRRRMAELRAEGVPISPYLELGAERCQRALAMENDLGATGAALDLSFDMLKACDHYRKVFGKERAPLRVCGDAYRLPFKTDSIPFVFCYETLHHFPDPTPIVGEIHRVLSPGGSFFFDEEPFKQGLHLNLYKSDKIYSRRFLQRGGIRKGLDHFFSVPSCNEVEHGIIENESISIGGWQIALRVFEKLEVKLAIGWPALRDADLVDLDRKEKTLAQLFGGRVHGRCQKAGKSETLGGTIDEALICPVCSDKRREERVAKDGSVFRCLGCGQRYPIVDNVVFLFSADELADLYPEVVALNAD